MTPGENHEAELALLGGLLSDPRQISRVPDLRPADFHRPANALIYDALLHAVDIADGTVDHLVVMEVLRARGDLNRTGGASYLAECVSAMTTTVQIPYYARLVRECKARRDILEVVSRMGQAARMDDGDDTRDVLADLLVSLGALVEGESTAELPLDIHEYGEFVERTRTGRRDWVIPGLLGPMERVLWVASEGAGKSTLSRQVAVALSQGRHPFVPGIEIPRRRVLMVDLENPPDLIAMAGRPLVDLAKSYGDWDDQGVFLWSRPAGINLRKASDVALLDRVMSHVRPALLCLGPLYKASVDGSDKGEQVAQEVTTALDRLREKHRCALWLEHHAPMSQNGQRELRPVGSGVWMRWPEFGRTLQATEPDADGICRRFTLGKFRPDRDQGRAWPDELSWGQAWPWEAKWWKGMPVELREDGAA